MFLEVMFLNRSFLLIIRFLENGSYIDYYFMQQKLYKSEDIGLMKYCSWENSNNQNSEFLIQF